MIYRVFTLLDCKVGTYSPPFFMTHPGHAFRAVAELGMDKNTTVGRHPADFMLYELGEWDDATATFTQGTPANHGPVVSFLPSPPPAPLFPDAPSGPGVNWPALNGAADREHAR